MHASSVPALHLPMQRPNIQVCQRALLGDTEWRRLGGVKLEGYPLSELPAPDNRAEVAA
jgi:hypothetical protein